MGNIARVTCKTCGDQIVDTSALRGRVCEDNGHCEYRFTCPNCDSVTVRHSERRIIDLLESNGVCIDKWELPRSLPVAQITTDLTVIDVADLAPPPQTDTKLSEPVRYLKP